MPEHIPQTRLNHLSRNHAIWKARVEGCTLQEIADAFNLGVQRIDQIVKQYAASIPAEERDQIVQMRREVLGTVQQMLFDMARMKPAPAFAPNGKAHIDPETGESIRDYSLRLNAIDRLLKADERIGKLTGTDNAVQHTLTVSAEAQQATKDHAARIAEQFAGLIPPSPEVLAHAVRGDG